MRWRRPTTDRRPVVAWRGSVGRQPSSWRSCGWVPVVVLDEPGELVAEVGGCFEGEVDGDRADVVDCGDPDVRGEGGLGFADVDVGAVVAFDVVYGVASAAVYGVEPAESWEGDLRSDHRSPSVRRSGPRALLDRSCRAQCQYSGTSSPRRGQRQMVVRVRWCQSSWRSRSRTSRPSSGHM